MDKKGEIRAEDIGKHGGDSAQKRAMAALRQQRQRSRNSSNTQTHCDFPEASHRERDAYTPSECDTGVIRKGQKHHK